MNAILRLLKGYSIVIKVTEIKIIHLNPSKSLFYYFAPAIKTHKKSGEEWKAVKI